MMKLLSQFDPSPRMRRLLRYGAAILGPVGAAVAQFALSVQVLHSLDGASFGAFAFMLAMFQFGTGLWSALFCAPLPIVLHGEGNQDGGAALKGMFAMNAAASLVAFVLFLGIGWSLGLGLAPATLFGAYVATGLLRWFARAFGYATGQPLRTIASDVLYSLALLGAVVLLMLQGFSSAAAPALALLVSAGAGLLPFVSSDFARLLLAARPHSLRLYTPVWRRHSGWSLLGVVTTEATGNAHVYLVTLLAGPSAFALLAATALLIRPIAVVMNALSEFERPQMARLVAQGDVKGAVASLRLFRAMLALAWVGSSLAAAGILTWAPRLLFPERYSLDELIVGTALWTLVAGARLLRVPESSLLQAAGVFRPLAYASLVSCWISLAGVLLLIMLASPVWSLLGVLFGEMVFAAWTWRQAKRWERSAMQSVRS